MTKAEYLELSKGLWRAATLIRKLRGNYRGKTGITNEQWACNVARLGDEAARLAINGNGERSA